MQPSASDLTGTSDLKHVFEETLSAQAQRFAQSIEAQTEAQKKIDAEVRARAAEAANKEQETAKKQQFEDIRSKHAMGVGSNVLSLMMAWRNPQAIQHVLNIIVASYNYIDTNVERAKHKHENPRLYSPGQ